MPPYTIELTPQAFRQFKKLPRDAQTQVRNCIDALISDPRPPGCENISGWPGLHRVRTGNYRAIYEVQDTQLLVLVVLIGDRRDIYQRLKDL